MTARAASIRTILLTPAEAAHWLGVSERTLRMLRDSGQVRYIAMSARTTRYRADDLEAYCEARAVVKEPVQCQSPSPKKGRHTGTMTSSSTVVAFTGRRD